ncbi:MAG: helix-turn-helix domain-containing protein [Lachnospiraceae bacterium]|nr:helix-turn-helix domain-containing protein [Lachnospiraceae bacterium]
MQIGQIIREYRKKNELTQEEMANRLGVTAPAVNKWENGNSMPDITLLAPIARLLGISLDTLLSFQEELTKEEITAIICKTEAVLTEHGFDFEAAVTYAKEQIAQYPNCEELILGIALTLEGWRIMKMIDEAAVEEYDSVFNGWYMRALASDREEIRTRAAEALYGFYFRKEQYTKAEEYLAYFSEQNPERKMRQANLYNATNRKAEAYRTYEELLFSQYQMTNILFHHIMMLAMQDNDKKKVHALAEKQSELARTFEMGEYYEISGQLEIAVMEKDADAALEIMEKMISGIERIDDFSRSFLYEHMTFRKPREVFQAEMKNNLLRSFRDEETYGFLINDKRWQELVK